MKGIIEKFIHNPDFQTVLSGFDQGLREQMVTGLSGSARQLMIGALFESLNKPLLVVTHNMFQAQKTFEDLVDILGEEQVLLFPANELIISEMAVASPETLANRIEVLTRLARKNKEF